jgi:hypothetical protein
MHPSIIVRRSGKMICKQLSLLQTLLIRQKTVTSFPTHFRKKRGNGWGTLTLYLKEKCFNATRTPL